MRKEAEDLLRRFAEGFRVFGRQRGWPLTVDAVPLAGLNSLGWQPQSQGQCPPPVRFHDGGDR